MKVLIACEESQEVCKSFRELGFEAYSCDIQDCSGGRPEWHINGDAIEAAYSLQWDLMIGHPPCTYLSYVGNRWFNYSRYKEKALERGRKRHEAIEFFIKLWEAPIEHICLENPRGFIQEYLKPSQIIHPYYFGDEQTKATCLWLKNLPQLQHSKGDLFSDRTHVGKGQVSISGSGSEAFFGLHILKLPQVERAKIRSKTFQGIAKAMASQWGECLTNKI